MRRFATTLVLLAGLGGCSSAGRDKVCYDCRQTMAQGAPATWKPLDRPSPTYPYGPAVPAAPTNRSGPRGYSPAALASAGTPAPTPPADQSVAMPTPSQPATLSPVPS